MLGLSTFICTSAISCGLETNPRGASSCRFKCFSIKSVLQKARPWPSHTPHTMKCGSSRNLVPAHILRKRASKVKLLPWGPVPSLNGSTSPSYTSLCIPAVYTILICLVLGSNTWQIKITCYYRHHTNCGWCNKESSIIRWPRANKTPVRAPKFTAS